MHETCSLENGSPAPCSPHATAKPPSRRQQGVTVSEHPFLENPPRFLFFTGKGGVGKTSLACATAVRARGRRASGCCW